MTYLTHPDTGDLHFDRATRLTMTWSGQTWMPLTSYVLSIYGRDGDTTYEVRTTKPQELLPFLHRYAHEHSQIVLTCPEGEVLHDHAVYSYLRQRHGGYMGIVLNRLKQGVN